jgi:hypothetical protein
LKACIIQGFDPGEKINGRKRCIVTDDNGLFIGLDVFPRHAAASCG